VADPPSADELATTLFAPEQPCVVRGDPAIGVVAAVEADGQGFVRLLAVDPDHRRRGHGNALLAAAEGDLASVSSVQIGADPPYSLWPGAPSYETGLLSLLERRKYTRGEANFHMAVDLGAIPADPGGYEMATAAVRDEVAAWMETHWAHWASESLRALDNGTLVIARDPDGISAFCAYDANRADLLGPVAVRPDLMGKGAGRAVLLGALHRMRAEGRERIEICWVGPVPPYAQVGGEVSRVFFAYRKRLGGSP
jgi:mycothiol synthase